jgi:microcystin-dependent protein
MANGTGIVGSVQPTGDAGQFLAADLVWRTPAGGDMSAAWPVGSIFLSTVATNPATLLGFGTWVAIAAGRMLVGFDAAQTEFDALGETGGAKAVTLTAAEMPAHTHVQDSHNHTQNAHTHPSIAMQGSATPATTGTHIVTSTATGGSLRNSAATEIANSATAVNVAATATNQSTGGGGAHANLPPYLVVSVWQRAS